MNIYDSEIQNDFPIFICSNSSMTTEEKENEDMFHSVFCELYVYDYFQNKKCLFKGLGKISISQKSSDNESNSANNSISIQKKPCVQQVNSVYGSQLKNKFSYIQNMNAFPENNIMNVMTENLNNDNIHLPQIASVVSEHNMEKFNNVHIQENTLNSDSECSNTWSEPISISNEEIDHDFSNQHAPESFNNFMEIDEFGNSGTISGKFINNQVNDIPLESLNNIPENVDVSNKLDYEMLLPHSVVESSSFLTIQSEQGSHDGITDYANMYRGLFDQVDDIQDLTQEEVDRKGDFEEYFENQSNLSNDDESYFITDISHLTQGIKRDSFSLNKSTEVACDVCDRKCRSINALNHHMLVHSEDRPFVCEICKKAFKEQPTLRRHMWTHMDKQHQCDICEKYFVEKSSLRRHISTIHADFKPGTRPLQGNIKQQFSCGKCGKVFKSHTKFSMHQDMHGNPNYECGVCGKVYAGRSHLKIHQRIHTGEKPYVCNICDMKFAFKHVLKSHQARIHQKIHKFKCNLCSLTFIKKSDLSSHASCHMINMKKNKRHYVSRKNSKKFATTITKTKISKKMSAGTPMRPITGLFGQLIDAVPEKYRSSSDDDMDKSDSVDSRDGLCKSPKSLIDQGKKNKECLECFKAFERMGDLKRHIISHIVENITKKAREQNHSVPIYECEACYNTVFKQVDKFKKHLREHAKLTLYQCKICDRAFGDSSNFSKHKKVHGESYLKCSICSRKFNTKRMMAAHMNYHRENKPKSCNYCKKTFHFDSNLRKHIKIAHLTKGKMTYRCEECGDRFNSVKLKWEHQWEVHQMRKVNADCHICGARFRKVSLLRAHIIKEHTSLISSKTSSNYQ